MGQSLQPLQVLVVLVHHYPKYPILEHHRRPSLAGEQLSAIQLQLGFWPTDSVLVTVLSPMLAYRMNC